MSTRVLIADDEEHILEGLKMNLELEGYWVETATDGEEALKLFEKERFDLIVLDVMMPKLDGYRVCEIIRVENSEVPIMFLTAKNSGSDRVHGLKIGADDYLTKPFNLEEFLLRVEKLLNRKVPGPDADNKENILRFGQNRINFRTFEIETFAGEKKSITAREAKLLKLLTSRDGEPVSRNTILETVWGYDVYPSTRTIDNFILAFRKYFEPDPKNPRYFLSIRGVGYKFTSGNR